MKTKNFILTILAIGIWNDSFSQNTEVEKYYVRIDTSFVTKLKKAHITSTEELIKTLEVKNDKRENLGFGYELKQNGKGLGSITINYQILYYKNEIISYQLSTYIPNKSKKLKKIYKEKISELFKVNDDYKVQPIYFEVDKAIEPLSGIDNKINVKLDEIMSPFSSIFYGTYCGEDTRLMKNRQLFNKIIASDNCEYLLYSKNPATRLMAIEFYYCNLNEFSEVQKKSVEARIEEIKKRPYITKLCPETFRNSDKTENIIIRLKNCS